jgi:serine/threonine protein kinase
MAQIYGERWKIIESLVEGGQAHTFLVEDLKGDGDTRYVLKRLKNIKRVDRFKREIEVVRNISHENVVNLIDFDLENEKPYLVMEHCVGGSLTQAKPFWSLSPIEAINLFEQVCEGVAYAHAQGVIHRDIKPDNIFLRKENGPAVVGDFGICFIQEDGERFTITEEAVGPRLFMAPELEDGRVQQVSEKSDTYSLGKLLYWLLSNGRIFSREKHRNRKWDLKGRNENSLLGWDNIYMEHINRLLDLMIVYDPSERRSVHNILILLRRAKKLVAGEFSPIAKDIPQPCLYCGQGVYVYRATSNTEVRNFGFQPVGAPDWRVLVCNSCGHVQAFRIDMAKQKEWWS